jgi:hypothetical protein
VVVGNIAELSTFFRRQVLLIRFAAKFASGWLLQHLYINIAGSVTTVSACPDMEMLMSQVALAAFLAELGEAVEEAELVCCQSLIIKQYVTQLNTLRAWVLPLGRNDTVAACHALFVSNGRKCIRPTGSASYCSCSYSTKTSWTDGTLYLRLPIHWAYCTWTENLLLLLHYSLTVSS